MGGNVSEWLSDWYYDNYYPFIPKKNPQRSGDWSVYEAFEGLIGHPVQVRATPRIQSTFETLVIPSSVSLRSVFGARKTLTNGLDNKEYA